MSQNSAARTNSEACTCVHGESALLLYRALLSQAVACMDGFTGESCLNTGHPIVIPTSATCAAAFQATYDISGGLEVFENLAEANEELNTACRAAINEVATLPCCCVFSLCHPKSRNGLRAQ